HSQQRHVKVWRIKSAPATATAGWPAWWPLSNANFYRFMRPPEGELRSGPMWLSGGVYPALRVQTAGPISQLGPTPPTLRVGAHTRSLVFLARGPGPYRLVWGGASTAPSAMPLAQLMPARQVGDSLPPDMATVAMPAASAAA